MFKSFVFTIVPSYTWVINEHTRKICVSKKSNPVVFRKGIEFH